MNEMVERVSAAMFDKIYEIQQATGSTENIDLREVAKAAIAAMKGATAPMKEAGAHSQLTLMASYGGDGAFDYVSEENAGDIFDQMIDAALKE